MTDVHPSVRALQAEIAAREKEDPLFGPKIAAHEIYQRVFKALQGERGVHLESMLAILGSLAGYACQVAVRLKAVNDGMHEAARLVRVDGDDGRAYWFGDAINAPLFQAEHSVWSLAAGGAQAAGLSTLPDIEPIIRHVSLTVGTHTFGVPRGEAAAHLPAPPARIVEAFWSGFRPILRDTCKNPMHWPVAIGIALQRAIEQGADALAPDDALRLVMECAIPMAKIDLGPLEAFALAERSSAS